MMWTTMRRTLAITVQAAACGAGSYAIGAATAGGGTAGTVTLASTSNGNGTGTGTSTGTSTSTSGTVRHITVTGTGHATGTPKELQLNLSVNTHASSVRAALGDADKDMSRVQSALKSHGVASTDLRTSGLSVQPSYKQGGKVDGYQVTESLTAVLRNMSTAGATIGAAATAGGNATRIDGVSLDLSDPSSTLLSTARTSAMADAKAKAQQYASAAGQQLGQVISISESPASTPVSYNGGFAATSGMASSAAVPVSPGSQQVAVTVTVTYALG